MILNVPNDVIDSVIAVLDHAADQVDVKDCVTGSRLSVHMEINTWKDVTEFVELCNRSGLPFRKLVDEIRENIPTDADIREAMGDQRYHEQVERGE